jgi:hypothetical protein
VTKPINHWPQLINDDLLAELRSYAAKGLETAPPQMCGVSADVLFDLCVEVMQRRLRDKNPHRLVATPAGLYPASSDGE